VPPETPVASHASTPITAAADALTAQGQHGRSHSHCENCGTELKGPFCHACGQHDFDVNRSFAHTALEALENFFHFDAKFFRNIITLLFRPGVLTAEFNAGKRASQMPPFRLYVFTAFLFFLIEFSGAQTLRPFETDASTATTKTRTTTEVPAPAPAAEKPRNQPRLTITPIQKPDAEKTSLERWVEHQAARSTQPEFQRALGHAFISAVPKLLLLCLPIFALYTRVLFRRASPFYLQHLIVALHFHTFLFLLLLVRDGWVSIFDLPGGGWGGPVKFAANLWLAVYPVLMLRKLFSRGWFETMSKAIVLIFTYALTLFLIFGASILAFVLWL
jgi:hypothetical protein